MHQHICRRQIVDRHRLLVMQKLFHHRIFHFTRFPALLHLLALRMLRQFEKTDNAGIGALINTGAEVSFKNMLSAVRSQKRAGMDFMVDDASISVVRTVSTFSRDSSIRL